jgi:thiosulfate dehydrogenase [quinone] large subunit
VQVTLPRQIAAPLRRGVPALPPGAALLPLRLFLGATFAYAGVEKLSDPGFLTKGADSYIGSQLEGFAQGTPGGWVLDTFALPHPELAGVGVAVAELAIGLLVLVGRFTRGAALAGLGLNLLLFLTATWATRPYFLGSDIVFVFAWLPLALAGAAGQPALDHVPARALALRRRGPVALPARGEPLTRRAAIVQALGFTGAATALLAGLGVLLRREPPPPPPRAAAGAGTRPPAASIGPASAVAPGESVAFTNPADGSAGLLVRRRDGSLAALGAACTHAGCDVEWRGGRVICPCHRSTFYLSTGAPERGPAREPLPVIQVAERRGQIVVG